MMSGQNHNILDCTTPDGLQALWEFTGERTKKDFTTDAAVKAALQNIILKFSDTCYVKLESYLGGGHWSYAFKVSGYNPDTRETTSEKMALKMTKPLSKNPVKKVFHIIEEDFKNLNADLVKEGEIYKALHGLGIVKQTLIQNRTVTCALIPFLGDMTLSSLLKESYYLEHIPLSEWLRFFLKLIEKLNEFHHLTHPSRIHNDIKPDNIALFLKLADENGVVRFGYMDNDHPDFANFIDFGNAQEPLRTGFFGDLFYSSVVNGIGGMFFPACKNINTDIFSLGATLIEVVDTLRKNNNYNQADKLLLKKCKKIFEKMASVTSSWTLDRANTEMSHLADAYRRAEVPVLPKEQSLERSNQFRF